MSMPDSRARRRGRSTLTCLHGRRRKGAASRLLGRRLGCSERSFQLVESCRHLCLAAIRDAFCPAAEEATDRLATDRLADRQLRLLR